MSGDREALLSAAITRVAVLEERLAEARALLLAARGLWGIGIATPFADPVGRTREATAIIERIDAALGKTVPS